MNKNKIVCRMHANGKFLYGRRAFLHLVSLLGGGLVFAKPLLAMAQPNGMKMLIIYFSHSGNTRQVAREIQALTHAEMVEILPQIPFPENYDKLVELAEKQASEHYLPAFKVEGHVDFNDFNVIFLGFPIWAYTMPMIIYSFLDKHKFAGKKIVPFCTQMGSGLADSEQRLRELCPHADILPGLAIWGSKAAESSQLVKDWLKNNGLCQQE